MSLENKIVVVYLDEGFEWRGVHNEVFKIRLLLADAIMFIDRSVTDEGKENALHFLKSIHENCDIPFIGAGNVRRFEDVKKYLYAGASFVVCNEKEESSYADGVKRFGEEKVRQFDYESRILKVMDNYVLNGGIEIKKEQPAFSWSDIKLNSDGMVPVIVQDHITGEVLMLAYMNEEAFKETIRRRMMVYFSRSRQNLWLKGETSGHYQYLKSMALDCDKDTILCKVMQLGAACHTGAYSCFFNDVIKNNEKEIRPEEVPGKVMSVILDRKANPKEGSYTNYLFDKGIDKILKKCGEEASEIIIAAKNPDKEEIKYEIADFLYHVMVLMAEKGITWEDVMKELLAR